MAASTAFDGEREAALERGWSILHSEGLDPADFPILATLAGRAEYSRSRLAMLKERWPTVEDVLSYLSARGSSVYFDAAADPVEPYLVAATGKYVGETDLWWLAEHA